MKYRERKRLCRRVKALSTFGIQLKMASKSKPQLLSGHCIMNADVNILERPCGYNIYMLAEISVLPGPSINTQKVYDLQYCLDKSLSVFLTSSYILN